jgi:polysaccharide pyruvyl transferase WcaK-like protein
MSTIMTTQTVAIPRCDTYRLGSAIYQALSDRRPESSQGKLDRYPIVKTGDPCFFASVGANSVAGNKLAGLLREVLRGCFEGFFRREEESQERQALT